MKCMKFIENIGKIDLIIITIIIKLEERKEDMNTLQVNLLWIDLICSPGKELFIDGTMNIYQIK